MTSFPARRFGFADRGVVGVGMHADLVVFDLDALTEHATYEAGRAPATGVSHVFVNGRPVLWEGELTGELPGRAVRSRGDPGAREDDPRVRPARGRGGSRARSR